MLKFFNLLRILELMPDYLPGYVSDKFKFPLLEKAIG